MLVLGIRQQCFCPVDLRGLDPLQSPVGFRSGSNSQVLGGLYSCHSHSSSYPSRQWQRGQVGLHVPRLPRCSESKLEYGGTYVLTSLCTFQCSAVNEKPQYTNRLSTVVGVGRWNMPPSENVDLTQFVLGWRDTTGLRLSPTWGSRSGRPSASRNR